MTKSAKLTFNATCEELITAERIIDAIRPLLFIDGLMCDPQEPSAEIDESAAKHTIAYVLREYRLKPWTERGISLCPECDSQPCICRLRR